MLTNNCVRGCGTRHKGGIYLCIGRSPFGRKIESFVLDPARIPPDVNWKSRAPKLIPSRDGVNHVYMRVSPNDYASFWDWLQESERYGLSRRVSPNFPFGELTPGKSTLNLIFPYGVPKFPYSCEEWTDDPETKAWWQKWCNVYKAFPNRAEGGEHLFDREKYADTEEYPTILNYTYEDFFYRFCTFAHRDLAPWFHYQDRNFVRESENHTPYYQIEFPPKNPQFHYVTSTAELYGPDNSEEGLLKMFLDRRNWHPAVLFRIPISHFEIPFQDTKNISDKIKASGYQTEITDW